MSNPRHILIKARRQIVGDRIGNNPSQFRGEGYDFIELREYMPGEDTRHIDWNITAKMQRPYVKVFREERELSIVSVAMLDGSLYFGQKRLKVDTVAEVVALVGYSALANGDLFSHYHFSEKMEGEIRGSKKRFAVAQSVEEILNFDLLNHKADYSTMASILYKRLKRRSLIVLVGDFFEIPDLRLLAKKHEVVAVVVRDRFEEKPSPMGFTTLIDPQNGAVLEGDFSAGAVEKYHRRVREHDVALVEKFRKDGVRMIKIYTDESPSVGLRRLFEGRV